MPRVILNTTASAQQRQHRPSEEVTQLGETLQIMHKGNGQQTKHTGNSNNSTE